MEVLGKISHFCRFCLSQDCENLIPLSSAIESLSFSLQDIQETTGISIPKNEIAYLAVCMKCCNRIELAVDFRRSCMNGNVLFLQLFGHIIDKLRSCDNAEENLGDAACVKDDPLDIDLAVENESSNEITYGEHKEAALLGKESIELLAEPTNNGLEDCEDENSSSEDPPLSITNNLRLKRKATSTGVNGTASNRRKGKTKDRNENSEENKVTKPNKSARNMKRLCGICGAIVSNLNAHTRSHTKENLHKCPQCPVQMAHRTNMVRHVQTVHEKIIVKTCEPCGKGITTNNGYKSHMRTHHNIGEQYQCKICLRMFNHDSTRRDHMKRIHIAERKYECQICQKKFKDPNALREHGRVHSTNTPYACSQCPKRFKSLNAKKTHEITHNGIQFPCTFCSKVYRYKSLLSMHYRKCHPVESSGE